MPWSTANGLRIFYEVAGEGPPLVLIHANPLDHTMWLYQVASFSRRYRVIAVDLRGYGRSDKPETDFTFAGMADDVLGVVHDLGCGSIAVAGVSIGATLALKIALDRPDLVKAAVLVGGESGNPPVFATLAESYATPPFAEQRRRHVELIGTPAFATSVLGRYLFDGFLENSDALSGRAIAQIFRARRSVNLQDRLSAIAMPVLVVNGESDVSLESGRYTAAHIPGAVHRIVADAGHLCCIEQPQAFDRHVLEFLAAIPY